MTEDTTQANSISEVNMQPIIQKKNIKRRKKPVLKMDKKEESANPTSDSKNSDNSKPPPQQQKQQNQPHKFLGNLLYSTQKRRNWITDFHFAANHSESSSLGNPHTWQRVALPENDEQVVEYLDKMDFGRLLNHENHEKLHENQGIGNSSSSAGPTRPYKRRKDEPKSALHWGQRKLFLSELEFLLNHAPKMEDSAKSSEEDEGKYDNYDNYDSKNPRATVVYAGAAPGEHLEVFCELFPNVDFVLYDPRPFSYNLVKFADENPDRMKLFQQCFEDSDAEKIAVEQNSAKNTKNITIENCTKDINTLLFISDIRSGDPLNYATEQDFDDTILKKDLDAQKRWCEILKPKKAMLKFRLPYSDEKLEYLKGEICLPIFGPQTTTETRLVVGSDDNNSFETKVYDSKIYGEQLFFFNVLQRCSLYEILPIFKSGKGLNFNRKNLLKRGYDCCFDCTSELSLLQRFIEERGCISKLESNNSNADSSFPATNATVNITSNHPKRVSTNPLVAIKKQEASKINALLALSDKITLACGQGRRTLLSCLQAPGERAENRIKRVKGLGELGGGK